MLSLCRACLRSHARAERSQAWPALRSWGLFRDRRPDLYGPLLTLDGKTTVKCTIPYAASGV
jgi:hypothetical protein